MDTIVALSSPPGGSERAVIRLSGPRAFAIGRKVAPVSTKRGVRAVSAKIPGFRFRCAVWSMPAPKSYTGEDSVEFHIPGTPPLVRAVIDRLQSLGAAPAAPGEFTRRAFLNGKMDLSQAEAVLRVIRAGSDEELRAAQALLQGDFSRRLRDLEERLLTLCADIEAAIDFVDQDIELLPRDVAATRLREISAALESLLDDSCAESLSNDAPTAVLVGRPNAGKSTLFNALTGGTAITSNLAGTTRDFLEGRVGDWRIMDAPGLFEGDQAKLAMELADVWIVVVEPGSTPPPVEGRPFILVSSKADLGKGEGLAVCAKSGEGLDELKRSLDEFVTGGQGARFLLSRRQFTLMRQSRRALMRTEAALKEDRAIELVALEAHAALQPLGEITGRNVDEDILNRIFERFCVGK